MDQEHGAPRRPVLLIILDGYGANPSRLYNGIAQANTPRLDEYFAHYPHTVLQASGLAVGMPDGQMGNSEVGHMTLGCGSVVRQDLVQINDAIADGSFFENEVLLAAIDKAAQANRPVHLMGLVSDGGIHSHVGHLLALIKLARRRRAKPLVHVITDGRDTPPRFALEYLGAVENALDAANGAIGSVSGRYYAMDRDSRWERTEKAWRVLVRGEGLTADSAQAAIEQAYERDEGDEFIQPTVLPGHQRVQADDSFLFFNFRKDRPRQLVSALFKNNHFDGFERGDFQPVPVSCMTQYDEWYPLPYAFEHDKPEITLAQVLSEANLKQFHCAETEKYAHVTFFFNGGQGDEFPGEDRVIIPSPKVATYDLKPEMSAPEVAQATIDALRSKKYAFLVVNFANGDMVGHTAVPEAIIKAVETLDFEVGRLLDAAVAEDYSVLLTADHGNCDEMRDPAMGTPQTQHSVYPVPCLIVDEVPWRLAIGAGLGNVSPTVLHLMGLTKPPAMTADSILLAPIRG